MIDQIISDILYFSVHYGAGAMAVGTLSVYTADKIRKRNISEKIYIALLSSYVFMVVVLTLLSRNPGEYQTVDLTMFDISPLLPTLYIAHYLENLIMLMPLGFLLPLGLRVFRNPVLGMTAGLLASSFIELSQYYTHLGTFAPDDIIANGIGSAIGYITFMALRKVYVIFSSIGEVFADRQASYPAMNRKPALMRMI